MASRRPLTPAPSLRRLESQPASPRPCPPPVRQAVLDVSAVPSVAVGREQEREEVFAFVRDRVTKGLSGALYISGAGDPGARSLPGSLPAQPSRGRVTAAPAER